MSFLPTRESAFRLGKQIDNNQFLHKQLVAICRACGLPSQGVKAVLQKTIVTAINAACHNGDVDSFRKLEDSIRNRGNAPSAPPAYPAQHQSQSQLQDARISPSVHLANPNPNALPSINQMSNHGYPPTPGIAYGAYGGQYGSIGMSYQAAPRGKSYQSHQSAFPRAVQQLRFPLPPSQGPTFHPSPFYDVIQRVGNVHLCQAMSQHRNSIQINLKAQDTSLLKRCVDDKSLRVMVFCGAEEHGEQDITFPHQSELKVNDDDVKANLRGLKRKPGSTRPVDITDMLRLRIPAYGNKIDFTYALTKNAGDQFHNSQNFWVVINICKSIPVEELVRKVSTKKITKATVIRELQKKANDDEIELSSQVMSLKCPISYMRLKTPVRADDCTHSQCFDATSYLLLQQQGPQWVCPVCSKPAPFTRLAIDEYVRDILDTTSEDVDQVDIQPDARWKVHGSADAQEVKPEPQYGGAFNLDDDDDEFEISDTSFPAGRSTATPVGYGNTRTPINLASSTGVPTPASGASREGSSLSRSGGAAKRSHEVIDLTLSEDDEPAPKRQQFNTAGMGYSPYQ